MINQTLTANEARTAFGEFFDREQKSPVRVTRRNRVVGVLVSAEDYEAMRAFCAKRLQHTLAQTAEHAGKEGLTPRRLVTLLADES